MRTLITLITLLTLSACTASTATIAIPTTLTPAEISFTQATVAAAMQNPASAQFDQITGFALSNGDRLACGEVIGRNGFGRTYGYAPFSLRYSGSTVKHLNIDDTTGYGAASVGCTAARQGQVNVSS